jgi:hypothetical protein
MGVLPFALHTQVARAASCSGNHDIITAGVNFKLFQRARRRTTDIFAAQVVLAVVAGAPNLFRVGAILHYAFEVGAHGRKRFELSGSCTDEDPRLIAELEDLA